MSQLSKTTRQPKAVRFSLTERDMAILHSLAQYRYLRTGQIQRLHFPENTSPQSTRRRLKYLFHHGFVGRIEAMIAVGKGSAEVAYFLDKQGLALLEDDMAVAGLPGKSGQVKPAFLQHALDVSEFQLCLHQAIAAQNKIALHRFTADFELKSHTNKAIGKHRYKLYDEVVHPQNRQTYTVYPDALVILRGTGNLSKHQRLYFVEIDRGTEGLKVIRNKIIGYTLYAQFKTFQKFGKFDDFRLLLQTNSVRRQENIRDMLTDQVGSERVWFTTEDKVSEVTMLAEPIWQEVSGDYQALLK